jgi:lysophospholipase L1-like esterase
LNLRILGGESPKVQAVGVAKAAAPTVLYIAGDSTVCDQDPQLEAEPKARFTGWGQVLPRAFRRGLSVANYADSGESTAAFRPDGGSIWPRIATPLAKGDFVLIQLGHNDKMTPAATYRSRITAMVKAIKAKGATPILVTPIARNNGDALAMQHIYGDLNVRSELSQIATSEQVPLLDLLSKTSAWAASVGRSTAQTFFVGSDATHTNELGAALFADFVVEGIRELDLPLKEFLRP